MTDIELVIISYSFQILVMDFDENVAKQIVDMLLACHQSDEETVRRLITEGFDVNQSLMPFHPEMPGTPLMVAARVDDDKIVRILLQVNRFPCLSS